MKKFIERGERVYLVESPEVSGQGGQEVALGFYIQTKVGTFVAFRLRPFKVRTPNEFESVSEQDAKAWLEQSTD